MMNKIFMTRNFKYIEISDAEEKFTGYYFEIDGQVYFLNKRLKKVAKVEKIGDSNQTKLSLEMLKEENPK